MFWLKKSLALEATPDRRVLNKASVAVSIANNITVWMRHNSSREGMRALSAAFFSWLGFIFPVLMNKTAWERSSWGEVGYYFYFLQSSLILWI